MAQDYSNSWKICATCAYWLGDRDCDYFGQRATVSSCSTQGRCAIPSGPWRNSQKCANASCNSWMKWPVLR